jgi:hypothetical protein
MAKISTEDKNRYQEKIKSCNEAVRAILEREKTLLAAIKQDPVNAAFKRLALVDELLDLVSNYVTINGVAQSMLRVKNEEALNEGRKSLYRSVIYLEETVSNVVDAPYIEYEEKLAALESVNAERRYLLIRKMGFTLQLLEDAYGDNTKWKWAFVELEGRFAVVAKNIFNLKAAVINTDPRSPEYEPTIYHLRLIKQLLMQAADRYREKYELSTNRIDDFRAGINFLGALRRIHVLMGEREEAEIVKKKQDIWSTKLEADMKRQEDAGLKKIL